MFTLDDVHLELGVLWLERWRHHTVVIIFCRIHLQLDRRVFDTVNRSTEFKVGRDGGEIFALRVYKCEPLMLLRVVLQVINEGQIELNLPDKFCFEEALRTQLDEDLAVLELCY